MTMSAKDKRAKRVRRHLRVRRKVTGTSDRPRLCVFRSLKHIQAQVIDDISGETMVSVSTSEPFFREEDRNGGNTAAASLAGKILAQRARDKGISKVVFDRGGYLYHGRVKALAEAAREGGLDF